MTNVYQVIKLDSDGILQETWDTFKDLSDAFEQAETQIMLVATESKESIKVMWYYNGDGVYEAWLQLGDSITTLTHWKVAQIQVHN